jgi:hypothetical protein
MPDSPLRSARGRRSLAVLRGFGFAVAVVSGIVAIWLIVTSTDEAKRVEIGVLVGLWGLLLGAFSIFGSRSHAREVPGVPAPEPGQMLDLRQVGEIERAAVASAVAAARQAFRAELEEVLRRETAARDVDAGLRAEVAGLRAEVAALRSDLVEKVGGQLRLERIETTRLIGSDLEALQHELRQLREIGGTRAFEARLAEEVPVADIHDAEIVVERVNPPYVPTAHPPQPAQPPRATEPEPQPVPAAEAARYVGSADPFAAMPRISPFTDVDLEPTQSGSRHTTAVPPRTGRHSPASEESPRRNGGRRHRVDGDGNDVLSRILARESRTG